MNISNATFIRHSGDYNVYTITAPDKNNPERNKVITLYIENDIESITAETLVEHIKRDPEILNSHYSKNNAYGPVNGHFYYFPTEGGGLLSSGHKCIKQKK